MPACFLVTLVKVTECIVFDEYDDDHDDHDDDDDGILVDAGMLSCHSGESHRVTLDKVFSSRHFVTLSAGGDE